MRNQCLKRKRRRMQNGEVVNKTTTTNGEYLHHPSLLKETRVERVKAVKDQDGEMTVYVYNGETNGIVPVKVERVKYPKDGIVVTSRVRNGIVIMMNMMMIGTGEDHRRSRHGGHGRNLVIPLLVHQQ